MNTTHLTAARPLMSMAALTLCMAISASSATAQTIGGPNNPNAPVSDPRGGVGISEPAAPMVLTQPRPVSAAIQAATTLAREPLNQAVDRALPAGFVSASQLLLAAAVLPSVSAASPATATPVKIAPVKAVVPTMPMDQVAPAPVRPAMQAPLPLPAGTPTPPGAASPMVQPVTVGAPVGDGVRVMRAPAACTPKTNSLDCVQDSSEAGQGANVSGRVRNSVIGEVGMGKATTEGAGGAQRQQACTPKPGELSCAN